MLNEEEVVKDEEELDPQDDLALTNPKKGLKFFISEDEEGETKVI